MKKRYMAPMMETYKMKPENLICISGKSLMGDGGKSSSVISGISSDAKERQEMEDAIDDLMDW